MSKRKVLSIHGICSKGEWHSGCVEPVLASFFDCALIDYPQFDSVLKSLRLFPIGAVVVVAAAVAVGVVSGWVAGAIVLGVGLALVCVLHAWAITGALRDVQRQLGEHFGDTPDVIAHSLGTFLFGRLLLKESARSASVVLCGSVLSRGFPWGRFVSVGSPLRGDDRVWFVRNETGRLDRVLRLVKYLPPLSWGVRHFGAAGADGFHDSDIVHSVRSAEDDCEVCRPIGAPRGALGGRGPRRDGAPAHNHDMTTWHTDQLTNRRHVDEFLLPFLWGFVPRDYRLVHGWALAMERATSENEKLRSLAGLLDTPLSYRAYGSRLFVTRTFGEWIARQMDALELDTEGELEVCALTVGERLRIARKLHLAGPTADRRVDELHPMVAVRAGVAAHAAGPDAGANS